MTDALALAREAGILARHLLGGDCPPDCVSAYVAAHAAPGPRAWQGPLDPASRFALAHPQLVGSIDAAGAVTGRARVLRGKLLLMAAILETTPEFADEFLPRAESPVRAALALGWDGLRVAAKVLIGIPLVLALGGDPA